MKKILCTVFLGVLAALPITSLAEISFTGFASINAGKVLSGSGVPHYDVPPTFLADYPNVSAYDESFSFKPESLFGLQATAFLGEGLSATAQIVSRGVNDFDAKFEWAYVSYELNDSWTIQAGKKRLPLFYYSDFYDVGYAYIWMRPPADNYTWQIFNYNGVNALYTGTIGDWSVTGNIYTGSEDDSSNKLLGDFFFLEPTREIWEDIFGGVVNFSNDWLEIRATHMRYTNRRFRSGSPTLWGGDDERKGKFYGLAVNAVFGQITLLSELNKLQLDDDGDLDTYMFSASYQFDLYAPYISYSNMEQTGRYLDGSKIGDGENHNTLSLGVRYDFHSNAALKIQFDKVKDNSYEYAVAGDSESITFGLDTVF